LSPESALSHAAQWYARSGIQEPSGGVARYYRTDLERNLPISTEITGYAISALLDLGQRAEALAAARFLCREAWNGSAMPFELEPSDAGLFTYFFDCGIIVRGLLAAWRAFRDQEFLDVAAALGKSMIADFAGTNGDYHPVLGLPEKQPLPYDRARWSRSPGCYQLKSGMAWWELFEITGDVAFREAYERLAEEAIRGFRIFLPGHTDPLKVVDRLHPFLYFLEALLPCISNPAYAGALCEGLFHLTCQLGETAARFERSDVYAQLLRIRIYADWAQIVRLDRLVAEHEAATLASFQATSPDLRIDGGFYFGRREGNFLPYVNPVSTAFGSQTLRLWQQHRTGGAPADWRLLI
jgi:hypothetical protein